MPLRIDPDKSENIQFLEFIIGKIKEKEGQEMENVVDIKIQKGITAFPVFEKTKPSENIDTATSEAMMDANKKYDQEADYIGRYLYETFGENIIMRSPLRTKEDPLTFDMVTVVNNRYGIYRVAEELKRRKPIKTTIKEKIIEEQNTPLPIVEYDSESGIGHTPRKKFKLKDDQPDYFVFAELYKKVGKALPKVKILELSGYIKNDEGLWIIPDKEKSEKYLFSKGPDYFINELAKKIRGLIGLTDDHLVVNNGNITLRIKKVKTSPKSPQSTSKV